MVASQKRIALALGLLGAGGLYWGLSTTKAPKIEAVSTGSVALAPAVVSEEEAPSLPGADASGVPASSARSPGRQTVRGVEFSGSVAPANYPRGGVGYSDLRIPLRKDRDTMPARPSVPPKRVVPAPAPKVPEEFGITPGPVVPPAVPSITPAPGGGIGPFPVVFAALVAGVALNAAFNSHSPHAPVGTDSVAIPPTTPPDTATPPTTPTDTTTVPPTTPPDTTTAPPTTPPDTTTAPPTGPVPPEGPAVPVTPTPEPSTLILVASGLIASATVRVRKRRKERAAAD